MIYILFSIFNICFSLLEHTLSIDEIKIFEKYSYGIEAYDQLQEKFVSSSLGVVLEKEQILQVISKFIPFDDEQRVDILTNSSNVYTIFYDKNFNGRNFSEKYTLQGAENCSSIAYVGDQFAVLCNRPFLQFVLQNETRVAFENSQFKVHKIQSYFGGLVALCENLFLIYDEQFNFEQHIYLYYIQLITTQNKAYLLADDQVFAYNNRKNYFHECQTTPLYMEVIDYYIYVKCETLNLLTGLNMYDTDLDPKSLGSTFQYLIINNSLVFAKNFKHVYYNSTTPLYPINYDNQVITIKENILHVGQIIGLYLISSNQSGTIKLNDRTIFIVGSELQTLHLGKHDQISTSKSYYFLSYLSGPDIQLIDGATVYQNQIINFNKDIITVFKVYYQNIGYIYRSGINTLSLVYCSIQIKNGNLEHKCNKDQSFVQFANNITKAYSTMIDSTNYLFLYLENGSVRFFPSQSNDEITDVIDFYYAYQYLVILKKNSTILLEISSTIQIRKTFYNYTCYAVAISERDITLLIQNNTIITLTNSIHDFYKSYQEQFSEKLLNINYVQNQLLVTFKDTILVYEKKILRGKIALDIIGEIKFSQSRQNLYIYNKTTVYVFQIYKEISLFSYLQQIIKVEEDIQNLQAISFDQYELLLINSKLYILEALKTFKFDQLFLVNQEQFANQQNYNISFANRYNQTAQLQFQKYGEILRLDILDCEEQFDAVKIEVKKLFYGPISKIEADNNIQIIERVQQKLDQQFWPKNDMSDILYLSPDQMIVIFNQNSINLCNQTQCQFLIKTDIDCYNFEEDQLYFYILCVFEFYKGLKKEPKLIEKLPFILDSPFYSIIKFNENLIFTFEPDNNMQISLYQDYQIKIQVNMSINDVIFNNNNIIILTDKNLIIYDTNFVELRAFDLFLLLQQQSIYLDEKEFFLEKIIKIKEDQFITSISQILLFEILLQPDRLEIFRLFNHQPQVLLKQLLLIDSNIFVCYGANDHSQITFTFYDFRDSSQNKKITPYFKTLQFQYKNDEYPILAKKGFGTELIVLIQNEIKTFLIHEYVQIINRTEIMNDQQITLIAYDENKQMQKKVVKIKSNISVKEIDLFTNILFTCTKLIGLILMIFIIYLIIRYIRRYFLQQTIKKAHKFMHLNNHQI